MFFLTFDVKLNKMKVCSDIPVMFFNALIGQDITVLNTTSGGI